MTRYEEGVEVLYSTNTIFLHEGPLLDALLYQCEDPKRCLVPQANLDLISLEIHWRFEIFSHKHEAEEEARVSMNEHLRLLSRAFPDLKKLYFSVADGMYHRRTHPDKVMDEIDAALLDPLGDILKRLTHLNEYTVALPSHMFRPLSTRALKAGKELVTAKAIIDRKFWQPVTLNGSDAEICNYGGFWIAAGEESDFDFDWEGKPYRLSTRPSVLL